MKYNRTISLVILTGFLAFSAKAIAETASQYLEQACVNILRSQLKRPDTLQLASKKSDSDGIYIDYKAKNQAGKVIRELAFCQVPDRGTVSMVTAHRREYSHLK